MIKLIIIAAIIVIKYVLVYADVTLNKYQSKCFIGIKKACIRCAEETDFMLTTLCVHSNASTEMMALLVHV